MRSYVAVMALFVSLLLSSAVAHAQVFVPTEEGGALQAEASTSAGASWGDYDEDGDLDLVVTDIFSGARLFRNDGSGVFQQVRTFSDLANTYATAWADLDNDGDLDLIVNSLSQGVALYEGLGEGDLAIQPTLLSTVSDVRDVNVVDFDADGLSDVLVTRRFSSPNKLLRNRGDLTFSEQPNFPVHGDNSVSGAWGDYDEDGDVDLYVTNTSGQPNRFYRNDSGTLQPYASPRVDAHDVLGETSSQSANWVDYDGDGDLDLFVANTFGAEALYRNEGAAEDGGAAFVPVDAGSLTEEVTTSLSSAWGDVDNDGDVDLAVSNRTGRSAVHLNDGTGSFKRLELGTEGYGFTSTLADYDADGDLDFFVAKGGANSFENNELFRNTTDAAKNWLQIRCIGTRSNRSALGTRIKIKSTIDGRPQWQVREVQGRSGRTGQSGLRVHFGLGDAAVVDSIVVAWPSGIRQVLQDVEPNQFLTITEEGEGGIATAEETVAERFFEIEAVHPNPFARRTAFRILIEEAGPALVEVYDVQGRRVRTLLNRAVQPGQMNLSWDARDDDGRRLATGVYFVRVTVAGRQHAAPVTLVR